MLHGMADKGLFAFCPSRLFSPERGKGVSGVAPIVGRLPFGNQGEILNMSSSLDHKCQRCGSPYQGQICPFCTITGLDVNALLASEGLSMPPHSAVAEKEGVDAPPGEVSLIDVVSNRIYPVNGACCRFGRDISNDIVLTGDKSLSRFHFQVTTVNNEFFVEDAGSRNGTFLNGAPVTAPKKILNGDIISAGMSRYRFVQGDPLAAVADAAASEEANNAEAEAGSADPLAKLMQEGQALLGPGEESGEVVDDFLKTKDGNGSSAPAFMQLDRPKETPIDELFQQQIRAAAAAKEQEEATARDQEAASSASASEEEPASLPEQETETAAVQATDEKAPAAPTPAPSTAASERDWPAWCTKYNFPELLDIRKQIETLEDEIKQRQHQLDDLLVTVGRAEDLRNRILATKESELIDACSEVLHILGWQTSINGTNANEVVLSYEERAVAIAKIVSTESQPKPADLANLVSSLSTYWCDHGVEPKGLLIVSMMHEGLPEDRPPFSKDIADYATKKNVCLVSTVQLLAMYRDAALRGADVESIRSEVLAASGPISGFEPVVSTTK